MKIDRLYAITVYLLNHGKTSANELAGRFEVSQRTIQRDIDALCLAGIPVKAETGIKGGYELEATFMMGQQTASNEDYSNMLTALHGLFTATNDQKVNSTLEKVAALARPADNRIILDFSVLREGDGDVLKLMRKAIFNKHAVSFTYTNSENVTRTHTVEPIAVIYRWYAWYLLAYSISKNDYRTYKLVRMSIPVITNQAFSREHESADTILKRIDTYHPAFTEISVRCKAEMEIKITEYLNGTVIERQSNGDVLMTLKVLENEQLWFGYLLSLGGNVEVIAPQQIRQRVLTAAENIVSLYSKL